VPRTIDSSQNNVSMIDLLPLSQIFRDSQFLGRNASYVFRGASVRVTFPTDTLKETLISKHGVICGYLMFV
jgi:hypothetical protein